MPQEKQIVTFLRKLGREALQALLNAARNSQRKQTPPGSSASGNSSTPLRGTTASALPRETHGDFSEADESPGQFGPGATRELHGQARAAVVLSYQPHHDNDPDPGEIVWTWVPYEENDGRGKDRPVLILGRLPDGTAAGCFMTSKNHDGRSGYLHLGRGSWDAEGRESWICIDRVLAISAEGMRREGDVVDTDTFVRIAASARTLYGWEATGS